MKKTVRNDYPYIRAWGQMMGSNRWYIDSEVAKAREEGAPPTATFKRSSMSKLPGWSTFEDITREDTKKLITSLVRK